MDVIIVCHTEFGLVKEKSVVFDKRAVDGVITGINNLAKLADKYSSKIGFAIMPEVIENVPKGLKHEIGLHVHPGWKCFENRGIPYYVGDSYLKDHCENPRSSTALRDYSYKEQLNMIEVGKDCIEEKLDVTPVFFVSGRWSINNDTVKALMHAGFSHECSALPNSKLNHYDWSMLPRICMPYHPNERNYGEKGNLPLLIVPVSQSLFGSSISLENVPIVGISWLKACFIEYYKSNRSLFHICLHSPAMTDPYYISMMDELFKFMSKYRVTYKSPSEVRESYMNTKTDIFPYIPRFNKYIIKNGIYHIIKTCTRI